VRTGAAPEPPGPAFLQGFLEKRLPRSRSNRLPDLHCAGVSAPTGHYLDPHARMRDRVLADADRTLWGIAAGGPRNRRRRRLRSVITLLTSALHRRQKPHGTTPSRTSSAPQRAGRLATAARLRCARP